MRVTWLILICSVMNAQTLTIDCGSTKAGGVARIEIITDTNPGGICYDYPASLFAGAQAIAASPVRISNGQQTRNPQTGALATPVQTLMLSPEQVLILRVIQHANEDQQAVQNQVAQAAIAANQTAQAAKASSSAISATITAIGAVQTAQAVSANASSPAAH